MGKKIDRIAFGAMLAIGLYLFFVTAFHNIWLSVLLAFVSTLLLRHIFLGIVGRLPAREKRRARARATLEYWARMDTAQATAEMRAVLACAYPSEVETAGLVPVLRHPQGAPLSIDALLEIWKANPGERLIVASTVLADPKALAYAKTLVHPSVRLMDATQLTELLSKYPQHATKAEPETASVKRRINLSISRERAPRRLLFGILLLAMYLLLGNILYLGAALLTLLFAALGFRKQPIPSQLFE